MSVVRNPAELLVPGRPLTLASVADGAEGLVIADLARAVAARADAPATSVVVICRDGPRMAALARALDFFAPDVTVHEFPAWDCLPYDRVSPHAGFLAQRIAGANMRTPSYPQLRAPGNAASGISSIAVIPRSASRASSPAAPEKPPNSPTWSS
jgi:transcription-repair coupling factor (superfamily II helicase)